MNHRSSRDSILRMIDGGLQEGHCRLCHTGLQNYIEEVVCPHWFLKSGPRAFQLGRLARVFEVYTIESVIDYLHAVTQLDKQENAENRFEELCQPHQRVILVGWRQRQWVFQVPLGADGAYSTREVAMATYYRDHLVGSGTIFLGPGAGEVEVKSDAGLVNR